MRLRRAIIIVSLMAIWALVAHAEVVLVDSATMIRTSDLVVLVKVRDVVKNPDGDRWATADVLEVWKGQPAKTIEYRASPIMVCDSSTAEKGELVVLMLRTMDDKYRIANSGAGRIVIKPTSSGQFVDQPNPIIQSIRQTLAVPEGPIRLEHLRQFVTMVLTGQEAKVSVRHNNRLKLPARGRSSAAWRLRARAAAYPGR